MKRNETNWAPKGRQSGAIAASQEELNSEKIAMTGRNGKATDNDKTNRRGQSAERIKIKIPFQMDFNFVLLSLDNWLIKEATLVEKVALELAVIKEQRQKVIGTETGRTECASAADNGIGICRRKTKAAELKEGENFTTRCGISWKFLTKTPKGEFEKLRRANQVSKNRGVGYGVRYACTRNAKARDNCPFLMLSRESALWQI
ncbi:hypothetical protein niasHT_015601 [Heterodera trifolii]|uniref:Uncharacterized protein n=1 Tax=Heterodera trifolii TaxID=157864 RepID=A0ABD2LCF1_9BILA